MENPPIVPGIPLVITKCVHLRDQFAALIMGSHPRCGSLRCSPPQLFTASSLSSVRTEAGPLWDLAIRVVWDWVNETPIRLFCLKIFMKGVSKKSHSRANLVTFEASQLTGAITSDVCCWKHPRPKWHLLCVNKSTILTTNSSSYAVGGFSGELLGSGVPLNDSGYFVNGKWLGRWCVFNIKQSWSTSQFAEFSSTTIAAEQIVKNGFHMSSCLLLTRQDGAHSFILCYKSDANTSVAQIEEITGRVTVLAWSQHGGSIAGIYQLTGSLFCIVPDWVVMCEIWDCNNTSHALRTIQIEEPIAVESFFAEGGLLFTLWNNQHAGHYELEIADGSSPALSTLLSITFPSNLFLHHFSVVL